MNLQRLRDKLVTFFAAACWVLIHAEDLYLHVIDTKFAAFFFFF